MSALDDKPFPKAPLIAAFLLVGASLVVVGGTRLGLIGSPAMVEAPRTAEPAPAFVTTCEFVSTWPASETMKPEPCERRPFAKKE